MKTRTKTIDTGASPNIENCTITGCKSAVDGLLWEQEDTGSIPVTPIASFSTGTLDKKIQIPYNNKGNKTKQCL